MRQNHQEIIRYICQDIFSLFCKIFNVRLFDTSLLCLQNRFFFIHFYHPLTTPKKTAQAGRGQAGIKFPAAFCCRNFCRCAAVEASVFCAQKNRYLSAAHSTNPQTDRASGARTSRHKISGGVLPSEFLSVRSGFEHAVSG